MSSEVSAVPDHGEKLNSLDYNLCPYIQSMGAAGIELAEKIIAAEQSAELNIQGPSVIELMEARRQKKTEEANPKIDVTEAKITEIKSIIPNQTAIKDFRPSEEMRIVAEIEEIIKKTSLEPQIEMQNKSTPRPELSNPETSKVTKDVSELKIKHELQVVSPKLEELTITDEIQAENIVYKVADKAEKMEVEIATETTTVEITPQIQVEDVDIGTQVIETNEVMLNPSIEEFSNFLSNIRQELGLEIVEATPEEIVEIVELDVENFEVPIIAISEISGADLLEELYEPISEVTAKFDSDLTLLIEDLEPARAEEVIDILQLLVKTIHDSRIEGVIEVKAPQVIEKLFAQLLELLELEDQDELVKNLRIILEMSDLIDQTINDQNLTIDQLNRLGTHEYKPTTLVSIFTSLLQVIKQRIEPYLTLGRCALSASQI